MASADKDPYQLHRAALAPLLPGAQVAQLEQSCQVAATIGEQPFANFLLEQGLAPLWDEKIQSYRGDLPVSKLFRDSVHQSRMHATGIYLLQHNNLSKIRAILDQASIPHTVLKGAHTRERYYDEPALRPAVDQDVLVSKELKEQAIQALQSADFTFYGVPENISHECSLEKGRISVDLHWDILRPGRTRLPMAQTILDNRQDYGSHWGPNDNACLFMLLVHPVFTKYLTAPQATLVRQLDLVLLMEEGKPDWNVVFHWLEISGLKTAAWLSLTWLELITGITVDKKVVATLTPGPIRQHYLQRWLNHNLATRWSSKPSIIQIGFTLPAHDSLRDSARAMRASRACRKEGPNMLDALDKELAESYHD